MLHFGIKPPISFERFLQICRELIPEEDFQILKMTSQEAGFIYTGDQPTLKKWYDFDKALRNELVKIRASRKHLDSLKFLRAEGYAEPYITHLAMNAQRNPSVLEAERALDQTRWQVLEELCAGHFFDLDFLIIYAYKLLLLERWEKIRTADKSYLLEEALSR